MRSPFEAFRTAFERVRSALVILDRVLYQEVVRELGDAQVAELGGRAAFCLWLALREGEGEA